MPNMSPEELDACVKRVKKAFEYRGAGNLIYTHRVITALWAIGDPKELKMPGKAGALSRCSRQDLYNILRRALPSWMDTDHRTIDTFVDEALYDRLISIPDDIPEHPEREMIALRPSGVEKARERAGF